MKDIEAFFVWTQGEMLGTKGGLESRKEFAAKHGIRLEDLEWAFLAGRMSMKYELTGKK